jgi:putative PEP-CTERM system histidine kinase
MQPIAVSIGTVSYAAAAAAFLFLFVLLVTSWRGRLQGILLAAASFGTFAWAAALAYLATYPDTILLSAAILEVARNALWFVFLMVLLGYSQKAVKPFQLAAIGIAFCCAVALAAALYSGGISSEQSSTADILSRLVLAVVGIVLVHNFFRNVDPGQRWGIKYLCLGLGALFVSDFYLYSDALLFRRVNADIWAARGVVNALIVPLLAISVARNPKWSLNISVSRRAVFYSTSVLGAAIYLMVMAAAGYYIRIFGGNWGVVVQITFWFGALLLLFITFFSGTIRARVKVFLSKNFFSYYYDYREEWLRFTRTLSEGEPGIRMRERSIQAIAELVDSPGGALWLTQDTGQFEHVAHWNMPGAKGIVPHDSPLCQFLGKRQWVVDLLDQNAPSDAEDSPEIPDWLRTLPQAWLVVPLIHHEQLLGFVVLVRSKGKMKLNWEVIDLLRTAGRQAASYLAQLEAAKALLVARQFESFNRMSAFVVHDLKNLIAQLSLLLSNAHKHKHKPEFQDDMISTVTNSVEKMERLLFQLRGNYTLERPAPVLLHAVLRGIVATRSVLKPAPELMAGEAGMSVVAHDTRLDRVLGHLVQNAIEATPATGRVTVQLLRQNGSAVVEISDTGCGMSEQFIGGRLFKPFESTKATGMGVGTYEAWQYIRELGGRIDVESKEAQGTTFRVVLPLVAADGDVEPGVTTEERS